jgi:hypothetical protein
MTIRLYHCLQPAELQPREAGAVLKANRAQPELRSHGISLDMHVRRLVPVPGVEEEPVRALPQDRWHLGILRFRLKQLFGQAG